MPTLSSLDRLARALQVDISALLRDAPRRHQDETAVLTTDPFLAEIAKYAEHLTSTQKSIFINHVRELAQGHPPYSLTVALNSAPPAPRRSRTSERCGAAPGL